MLRTPQNNKEEGAIAPSCACVIKSLLGADLAMGQPKWAESASWWAPALFWTAERSPNVAERSEWGALRVFSKSRGSDMGRLLPLRGSFFFFL